MIGNREEVTGKECSKIIWPIVVSFSSRFIVRGSANIDVDFFHFLGGVLVGLLDSSRRDKDIVSASSKEDWDLRNIKGEGRRRQDVFQTLTCDTA